ncbi:MAG: CidA/LrgA family protein [Ruminococcaceae bacterium]|nr:CidA/LrgA family protein [Oscillospiraceae bacterium]
MQYLTQLFRILLISFLGEMLARVIPFPMPASVYGIVLMLICLKTGIIKLHQVEKTADFLLEIMPVLFVPAGVGLLTVTDALFSNLLPFLVITLATTVFVMAVTGTVAQLLLSRSRKGDSDAQ